MRQLRKWGGRLSRLIGRKGQSPALTRSRGWLSFSALLIVAVLAGLSSASASTPSSGTIGPPPNAASVSWEGPDVAADTAGPSEAQCTAEGAFCDDFSLTVNSAQSQGSFTVRLDGFGVEDVDLYIYDRNGNQVGSSGQVNGLPESATVECPSLGASPYKVRAVYFLTVDDGDPTTPGYAGRADYTSTPSCVERIATYNDGAIAFGPSTVVSPTFFLAEPQTTIERRAPWTPAGAPVDPDRIFVDAPVAVGIGQLHRSLDGGDSFRLLYDLSCANRSRPNCATGGGGDTEDDVSLVDGRVFFSDQESFTNEAYATSGDHGDTFLTQTPVSNTTAATDRQWLAATDHTAQTAAGQTIEAFFSYNAPAGAHIQAITTDTHLPVPQPVPQLPNSFGQMRVDNNPSSPGHGWIYLPHIGLGGISVATARSADYALPASWHTTRVSTDTSRDFRWVAVDDAGNAYVTWRSNGDGKIYYSFSPIADARNNPSAGGTPGTYWSTRARITPPSVTSAVFPEITAGDEGRIGVTYMGTSDFSGVPDDATPSVKWRTYGAVVTNAISDNPVVNTGLVSHRVTHQGNICTAGTACGDPATGDPSKDDRSLLDMIDLSFDESGRLGVVYMDNYTNSFQNNPDISGGVEDLRPFAHFAKQVSGPSIDAAASPLNVPVPRDARADPAGDATWPNRAYTDPGQNLPSLDALGASLALRDGRLVARLKLADATTAGMQRDIAAYNAVPCAPCLAAERLQYIVRFYSADEAYHLSMEALPSGATRFYGGRLDRDRLGVLVIGAAHLADASIPVTGQVENGELVLSTPAASFGLDAGDELYSVTGFATAGPLDANDNGDFPPRTVDATPPFETTLRELADLSLTKTDSPDPVSVGGLLTYALQVTNNGPSSAKGVTLTDLLPKSVRLRSARSDRGRCAQRTPRRIECNLAELQSSETATVTIEVRPTKKGTLVNTASVSASQPIDPDPANNTATATTQVTP